MMGATIGLSGCSGDKNISSVNSTIDIESVYYRSWEDDGEKADIAHMLREFVQTIGEALVTDEQVENVIELFKPYMEQEVYTEFRDT